MSDLMNLLHQEKLSCVIEQHGILYKENGQGIAPILSLLHEHKLKEARVADKVIGKAAAMMMCYGGVHEVETLILSKPAYQYFIQHHIPIVYHELVPNIINRNQDGICPMEECVLYISDLKEAHDALVNKIASMRKMSI